MGWWCSFPKIFWLMFWENHFTVSFLGLTKASNLVIEFGNANYNPEN